MYIICILEGVTNFKGESGGLDFVDSLHNLLDGSTRGICNLCDMESLITLISTCGGKPIVFTVIGYYFVLMEVKAKLIVEYLEIEPNLLHNWTNLRNPFFLSSSGRHCS